MKNEVFKHTSRQKTITTQTGTLETTDKNGIVCSWTGKSKYDVLRRRFKTNLAWDFNWTKLKNQGADRLTGFIIVKPEPNGSQFGEQRIDVDFQETIETEYIQLNFKAMSAIFEYHLTPHYSSKIEKVSYDEMFAASEMNDTVLVVEGKKLYVNKVFLSYHSEFFRALFSSNFKERQLNEIPIKDVSFEDFELLMSTIYPKTVFPNDETAEKLLELADRFLMPAVICQVEHHLLEHSNLGNEKLMWFADAYSMPKLLEKCIRAMDTVEKAKAMQNSEECKKMSDGAKAKLFDRLTQVV